jgi:hypothetical protein
MLNAVSGYIYITVGFAQTFRSYCARIQSFAHSTRMMTPMAMHLTSCSTCLLQMSKGITVKDVSSHEFVVSYAAHLKKQGKIQLPELVDLMKTGIFKELAPYNDDWFYVRCGMHTIHAMLFSWWSAVMFHCVENRAKRKNRSNAICTKPLLNSLVLSASDSRIAMSLIFPFQ